MTEPTYYAIIPASVRYDKSICANAKLLYGEITCLSSKHGYCFASNDYFAELYDVHKKTISEWVKSLHDSGHIVVEVLKERGNERRIAIHKKTESYPEKDGYPIREKTDNSITSVSIKNNTSLSEKDERQVFGDKEINDFLEFIKLKTELPAGGKLPRRHASNLLKKLKKEFPCEDPLSLAKQIVSAAISSSNNFLATGAANPDFLYYNWQKIILEAKISITKKSIQSF